ncbi:phosphate regulon sensor histidine kinase PhoR [Haliea sp. E1-2-M8]|uniref:phosphate regulon sensor histidine kinase PhoR n=1 Tax=Haliea sp. E1-2-M8 TaxID=3064706 RepID=UPI00271B7AF4|nr:phosphate regulon sensor histidine kinase PhoR [Haliea sp. E1-2-M8]MDO8863928.1 phosphate regulon sensor histidine kinase PhoR [Haliea sp. E1-2-M8]
MNAAGAWLVELRRLVLLSAVALVVGWLVGAPWLVLALALLALLARWLYQLQRLLSWLADTSVEPPEAPGIWGVIYDRLYQVQRAAQGRQAQLQSRLDYLQGSLSAMHDGAVMVTASGAIEWSNTAAERLLGLRYPADRGQALLNLVRLPEFHRYFLAAAFDSPLQVVLKGEHVQYLQFTVTSFGGGDRLVFVRDVTKEAKLEQMRRDFVGNVSHELRTPLTVIKGYLETILANADQLEQRFHRPLQQMQQQAARMETLLKDLLWLSRIESVRTQPRREQVNIGALLQEMEDELQTSHPGRKLAVQLETAEKVAGDYRELHSAVSNLVLNAFKYSKDDTVVTVRWRREGEHLLLSVQDRGIGIDSVHLPRVTERFYRVDDSRSSATGGTGLGLAIVKHVAAAHRAELRIESTPGVGSTFTLVFPG